VLSFAGDAEYVIRHAYLRPTKDNRMIHLNRGVFWGALLLLAALAGGCKKHGPGPSASGASNAAPADQSAPAAAAVRSPGAPVPMPYTPAPVAAPANGDMNATLEQLSLDLRRYVVSTRSVPKNFEEFVAKSHAQIPPAPAGKKYIIQEQAVVLVKR
jgi:hypothetical protein